MTPEERRRILGDDCIAHIHARVAQAPEPSPELIDWLRRILAPAVDRVLARKARENSEEASA
ncbi:hypothetical protein [Streptomyces spectabilis]|uniref:Uncharacterized protein n=1 Tax=Streptomyces spectabilis TaxID=68270 RepID=A0A5P2X492_STRST|nr:hypothetical protein [Streptomyces spectabilis]MBB5108264.1 hypothetical protein [Streptomyces spectabilis]QEV58524.1 hypothetical protein CP982_07220 [Streptomyces spectabilis]GGV45535.1 hypothetical protein GCM10010245_71250 [Streptomyces spectabilis]